MVRKKFTTTLDENLIRRLKVNAAENDTDASKILEIALEMYFTERDENKHILEGEK